MIRRVAFGLLFLLARPRIQPGKRAFGVDLPIALFALITGDGVKEG